jgi:adenosyl cobinamide kinase/adenosyl cobinamide phosphate guanylyltransferase
MPLCLFLPFASLCCGPLAKLKIFGCLCPCHESDEEYQARIASEKLTRAQDWMVQGVWMAQQQEVADGDTGTQETWSNAILRLVDLPDQDEAAIEIVKCEEAQVGAPMTPVNEQEERLQETGLGHEDTKIFSLSNISQVTLVESDTGGSEICVWRDAVNVEGSDSERPTLLLRFQLEFNDDKYTAWYNGVCCCFQEDTSMTPAEFVVLLNDVLYWNSQRLIEKQENYERQHAAMRLREERQRLLQEDEQMREAI